MEFLPPSGVQAMLLYAVIGLVLLLQALRWRQLPLRLFLPFIVFSVAVLRTQRLILPFAIVAMPYLAHLLSESAALRRVFSHRKTVILLPLTWAILYLLVIRPDPLYRPGVGVYEGFHPKKVFELMLERVPRQNIYNDMRFGGGMLWWVYPEFKPFIDGRCEAYSLEFWRDEWQPVSLGEAGWRSTFVDYDVHGALLPVRASEPDDALSVQLFRDPAWALVAFTDQCMFFLERNPVNDALIAELEYTLFWPGELRLDAITPANAGQAVAQASRAVAFDPKGLVSRTSLARAFTVAKNFEQAIPVLGALIDEGFAQDNHWGDYAYCLFMAGRIDDADAVLSLMIKREMSAGLPFYLKHFVLLKRGDGPGARAMLEKALLVSPGNPQYTKALQSLGPTGPTRQNPSP